MKQFNSIADLNEAIAWLANSRHRTTGQWTTSQIFYHLAAAFEASIEGVPPGYPAIVRWMVRPFRGFVIGVRFPPWLPIPAAVAHKLRPPADANLADQFVRLQQAIRQFEAFEGEHPPHPVLGSLSRSEWVGFHLRHCQHHLGFIVSDEPRSGGVKHE